MPYTPLTTQEKYVAYELKKAKELASTSKLASQPKARQFKKPRLLPHPNEIQELRELSLKRIAAVERKGKPLTTLEKMHAFESKAMAKEKPKKDGERKGRDPKKKARVPGTLEVITSQAASSLRFVQEGDGAKSKDVLLRRTPREEKHARENRARALKNAEIKALWTDAGVQRFVMEARIAPGRRPMGKIEKMKAASRAGGEAERLLLRKLVRLAEAGVLPFPGKVDVDAVDLEGEKARFRFMDLPKEARARIYRLVVVEQRLFVRPTENIGQQQPDLAVVSRQVRAEVLPVFYKGNIFAIDVRVRPCLSQKGSSKAASASGELDTLNFDKKTTSGKQAIKRWAKVLEDGGWLQQIQHWIFDSTSAFKIGRDDFMLSVKFQQQKAGRCCWKARVEIHREASCILPGIPGHGQCTVRLTPMSLNNGIVEICERMGRRKGLDSEILMSLVELVESCSSQMVERRCRGGGNNVCKP